MIASLIPLISYAQDSYLEGYSEAPIETNVTKFEGKFKNILNDTLSLRLHGTLGLTSTKDFTHSWQGSLGISKSLQNNLNLKLEGLSSHLALKDSSDNYRSLAVLISLYKTFDFSRKNSFYLEAGAGPSTQFVGENGTIALIAQGKVGLLHSITDKIQIYGALRLTSTLWGGITGAINDTNKLADLVKNRQANANTYNPCWANADNDVCNKPNAKFNYDQLLIPGTPENKYLNAAYKGPINCNVSSDTPTNCGETKGGSIKCVTNIGFEFSENIGNVSDEVKTAAKTYFDEDKAWGSSIQSLFNSDAKCGLEGDFSEYSQKFKDQVQANEKAVLEAIAKEGNTKGNNNNTLSRYNINPEFGIIIHLR